MMTLRSRTRAADSSAYWACEARHFSPSGFIEFGTRNRDLLSDSGCVRGSNLDRLQLQRSLLREIRPKYSRHLLQRPRGHGGGRLGAAVRWLVLRKPVRRDALLRAHRIALKRTSYAAKGPKTSLSPLGVVATTNPHTVSPTCTKRQ
jgi:hypothetical protein